MRNKTLLIKTSVSLEYLLLGFVWLGVGILNFFDEYIICQILSLILYVIGIIGFVVRFIFKKEKFDEMADYHLNLALSLAFRATIVFILLLIVIDSTLTLLDATSYIKFDTVAPFIYAVGSLTAGFIFLRLERSDK